jgi:hypothetical protein
MRGFVLLLLFIGLALGAGAGLYLFWQYDWRWQPKTLEKDQAEIGKTLDQAGWVSPHLTGPKLYLVVTRGCADCSRFEAAEFPKLQAAEVDTRVIVVAEPDVNGQTRSTPAERATVGELWTNRSWKLFQQWQAATPETWTAPGVPPADGDAARTAVVGAGAALVDKLSSELKDNGVGFAYPTLIWWTKDGRLRGCVCNDPRSWRYVEQELGAAPA